MNRLERRYRLTLRMLPQWYRDDREEEMVGTFLTERTDDHDLEYAWPGWRETGAVAALGIRARLAGDVGPIRALVWGGAVRLVALLGLLLFAAQAVAWEVAGALHGLLADGPSPIGPPPVDWFGLVAWMAPAAAFLAVVLGYRTAAKTLAGLGFVGIVAVRIAHVASAEASWPVLIDARMWLLLGVPVLCLLLGFHREAPAVRRREWMIALAVATTILSIAILGQLILFSRGSFVFIDVAAWAFALGTSGYLLARRRRPGAQQDTAWLCALAVLGVLSSAVGAQSVIQYSFIAGDGFAPGQRLLVIGLVESIGVVIVTVVVASAARRGLRRLSGPIAESGRGTSAPTPA